VLPDIASDVRGTPTCSRLYARQSVSWFSTRRPIGPFPGMSFLVWLCMTVSPVTCSMDWDIDVESQGERALSVCSRSWSQLRASAAIVPALGPLELSSLTAATLWSARIPVKVRSECSKALRQSPG